MKSHRLAAILQAMAAFMLWSTLGLFFNWTLLPTSVYVVFGSLVGLIVLYLYFYVTRNKLPTFHLSWPLVGLFSVAGIKGVIWFRALALYPIAKAMLIHNLAPVVAVILSPILIREKPRINHLIAIITGFLGLVLLFNITVTHTLLIELGALLSLGTAVCSGFQDICQRKLARTISGQQQALIFILGQALISILFLIPAASPTISWGDLGYITYFGIIGTALPIILLSQSFAGLKAFEVSTLGYAEPALGALWGALFLNQPIIPTTALGGLLIFLSGITAIREE